MSAVKCPNPGCPYQFDPSRVPAGVALTCPRCGMRFALAAPNPPSSELAFDPGPAVASGYRRRPAAGGSGTRQTLVVVVLGLALLAAVGAMVYFRVAGRPGRADGDSASAVLRDKDLAFEPPGPPWVRDDALLNRLGNPYLLLYRRPGDSADAGLAFGAVDYRTREPRPGELRDGLTLPLGNLFDDVILFDREGGRWLGRPALGHDFRGRTKADGSAVAGRCWAVGHKGVGYWLIDWVAEGEAADRLAELDATRGTFRLLGGRAGWAPKEAAARAFAGRKAGYEVTDHDGAWAEPPDRSPADVDPNADLLLVARERRKGRDFVDEATFVVAVIDGPAGDPLAAGRTYAEARRAKEVEEMAPGTVPKFADRPADPDGEALETAVPVLRLHATVPMDRNQTRLVVVAAVPVGDKVAVGYGWCAWADRHLFEARLVRLAGSLKAK